MKYLATQLTAAESIGHVMREPSASIAEGYVRITLETASICGTDMHYFKHFANAGFELQGPVSLGHEACGRVVDGNRSGLTEGTLVALNPIINCGHCESCRQGEENFCYNKRFPGSGTTVPHIDGFFQEVIDHPAICCRPVDNNVDPRHLTFAEPLACALHAVNKAKIGPGDRVLITGCGPMGLLAVAAAVSKGADVSCVDLRPAAAALGKRIGATYGATVEEFEALEITPEFDAVVEASGAIPGLNLALNAVRRQGRVSILSNIQVQSTSTNLSLIMLKEITVTGSFQFNREFEEAVQIIESGRMDFDAMIATEFPLNDADQAIRFMISGKLPGKVLLSGK